MVSSHSSGSNLCKGRARPDGFAMRFQWWIAGRPLPISPFSLLSNANGKAAYWVIAGLFLVIVFFAAVFWYLGSGIEEKQSPSVVALSRDQIGDIPHRYKIERPAKVPVKPVAAEVSQDAAAPGAPEGPSVVSAEKETQRVQTPERTAVTQEPISPPRAIEQPSESLAKEEKPILVKEGLDLKAGEVREAKSDDVSSVAAAPKKAKSISPEEPISIQEDSDQKKGETREVPSDDSAPGAAVPEKAESRTPPEAVPPSPPVKGGIGKRFFVQVDVGNVRNEPSMDSKVKFQVQKGCSVTVTDKRGEWYAIQMDDGRSGWVYQTLIADSLVPQKDIESAVREITAIEVESPADDVVKLLIQLSAPHVPETLIIDEENPRVVCDFIGTRIAPDIGSRIDVNNGMIEKIRIGLHQQPQSKVRVVLDLVPGPQYEIKDVSKEREGAFVLQITAKRPR